MGSLALLCRPECHVSEGPQQRSGERLLSGTKLTDCFIGKSV